MTIIAGTGHRPKYCPCKYDKKHTWLLDLKDRIKTNLLSIQPVVIISGMAIGFDTWLAQVALELNFPVHAYIPFPGQENNWPFESRSEYRRIIRACEKSKIICKEYHPGAFTDRDRAMVDDADTIFSLLNPEAKEGGTYYTVQYANQQKKKVVNLWT